MAKKLDGASVLGTVAGVGAILGGQVLEGGHPDQIMQGTAALIVFGGTAAAVLLSFGAGEVVAAMRALPSVYVRDDENLEPLVEEIFEMATLARKEGILALDSKRSEMESEELARGLKYVIDGFDAGSVREILEGDASLRLEHAEASAKVFESAGSYAPTVGILGAVLGLIHVMSQLDDPSKIGPGIAVAFVATVYGVASANLFFLPWASKLRKRARERVRAYDVVVMGVNGIQEGMNPLFLKEKLWVAIGGGGEGEGGSGEPEEAQEE